MKTYFLRILLLIQKSRLGIVVI